MVIDKTKGLYSIGPCKISWYSFQTVEPCFSSKEKTIRHGLHGSHILVTKIKILRLTPRLPLRPPNLAFKVMSLAVASCAGLWLLEKLQPSKRTRAVIIVEYFKYT